MQLIDSVESMRAISVQARQKKLWIGFVPTMGYLHQGHLSLVKKSVEMNDKTCVSIFVNPTQFGPEEDFDVYPRDFARDFELLRECEVDWLFYPSDETMYPDNFGTYVEVEGITKVLCGNSRPGHFRGVTTIVSKLFNIVRPHRAYFGQKDGQQLLVIQRMVEDLNMGVEIVPCPTWREEDGLAMSSRNKFLSPQERRAAVILYDALQLLSREIERGNRDGHGLKLLIEALVKKEPLARLDYFAIVDRRTLREVEKLKGPIMAALAVYIGKTRLIDNIWLEV